MKKYFGASARALLIMLCAMAMAFSGASVTHAVEKTDIGINLTGPRQSYPGGEFTYTADTFNLGPVAADGSTVTITASKEMENLSVECLGGGCGEINISDNIISIPLTKFSVDGRATITLKGVFGQATSASVTAEIAPPSQLEDVNPESNTAIENTTLSQAKVSVSTSVSSETVENGGTITVINSFQNTGTVPVKDFELDGHILAGHPFSVVQQGRTECHSSSDICPEKALGQITKSNIGYNPSFAEVQVDIAPHEKVVFESTYKIVKKCDTKYYLDKIVKFQTSYNQNQPGSGNVYHVYGDPVSYRDVQVKSSDVGRCSGLRIDKTVDKGEAENGESRLFKISISNPSDAGVTIGELSDFIDNERYSGLDVSGTVECSSESTAPCPVSEGGNSERVNLDEGVLFEWNDVSIPAGKRLVLNVPVTISAKCEVRNSYAYNNVIAKGISYDPAASSGMTEVTDRSYFEVSGLSPCEIPKVRVSAEDLPPQVHHVGDETADLITLENVGDAPVVNGRLKYFSVNDYEYHWVELNNHRFECVPEKSTGECADFNLSSPGQVDDVNIYKYSLEPGKKLVVKRIGDSTSSNSCPSNGEGKVKSVYDIFYSGENLPEKHKQRLNFDRFSCNDVSIDLSMPTLTPEPGSDLPITVKLSNGAGVATDASFSMQLPGKGYKVSDQTSITCKVNGGEGPAAVTTCPELIYDSESHVLRGEPFTLAKGDALIITIEGTAGMDSSESHAVVADVKAPGDSRQESNTAKLNYGIVKDSIDIPTEGPTADPTVDPSVGPSNDPTVDPTDTPTATPTVDPTVDPTDSPTVDPTVDPSEQPTVIPTVDPTADPTVDPTDSPTVDPTADPTDTPTVDPSEQPTVIPTVDPTAGPTVNPTADPTDTPSVGPSNDPTVDPTDTPTVDPTADSSDDPTVDPSEDPTVNPTVDSTTDPTDTPTVDPSKDPTMDPSEGPSSDPSEDPSNGPSNDPSGEPSDDPSDDPSGQPSDGPTDNPSAETPSSSPHGPLLPGGPVGAPADGPGSSAGEPGLDGSWFGDGTGSGIDPGAGDDSGDVSFGTGFDTENTASRIGWAVGSLVLLGLLAGLGAWVARRRSHHQ